jgi:hypothetical protein
MCIQTFWEELIEITTVRISFSQQNNISTRLHHLSHMSESIGGHDESHNRQRLATATVPTL